MSEILARIVEIFRLELMLQLVLATVLGGAVGLERELEGKPAGLRTNILICIGSALYTKLSMSIAGPSVDPTRVAAQIVTGVASSAPAPSCTRAAPSSGSPAPRRSGWSPPSGSRWERGSTSKPWARRSW